MTQAFISLNQDAKDVNPDHPWLAEQAEEWDRQPVEEWIATLDCSDLTRAAIRSELENNQTIAPEKQSYLSLLAAVSGAALGVLDDTQPSEYWTESEVFRRSEG